MKKLLLLIAFLSTTCLIAQENEVKIGSTAESTYYLIKNTVRRSIQGDVNNTYIECWLKVVYKKDQIVNDKKYSNVHSMNKVIVNCYGNQYKLLDMVTYDSKGDVIKSSTFNEFDPFTNVVPNTVGWKIVEVSCMYKE